MNKQVSQALLAGLVFPLLLAALRSGAPIPADVERGALESIEASSGDAALHLTVRNGGGNLQQMTLESYLVGVVLAEMPASFEPEALKAQAVVARTYTRKRMNSGKHGDAAVCMDSTCCQAYIAPADYTGRDSDLERVRQAVAQTDGLVLCYGGQLIDATYFSCSGGTTEDAVAVWGQDVPYLQSVDSPGEEDAPRYWDTVTFTADSFAATLGISGDPAGWFTDVSYTEGGGVDTVTIGGKVFRGTKLRSLLGLRSTVFSWEVRGNEITITTRGFGHRVGMSQYGAQAMAEAGSDFRAILSHYYQGTALTAMGADAQLPRNDT